MKLIKTNTYRVRRDTPEHSIGMIRHKELIPDIDMYPHIFTPIYEFEDGFQIGLGEPIYRIDYDKQLIKTVQLSPNHLEGRFELFSTKEKAEKALKDWRQNIHKKYDNKELYKMVEYIYITTINLKVEELSIAEIKKKLEYIHQQANMALGILKSKS